MLGTLRSSGSSEEASIAGDYALLAEYLGQGLYGGVHVYAVDRDGVLVFGRLFNSHFREFRRSRPASPAEGTRFVIQYLDASQRSARN